MHWVVLLCTIVGASAGGCPTPSRVIAGVTATNCERCVATTDTTGLWDSQCEYCSADGSCSSSTFARCSGGQWLDSRSQCSGSSNSNSASSPSWQSRTGTTYCSGGYEVSGSSSCPRCDRPSEVGSDHPGATWCSVPYGNCCSRCQSGYTTSTSGSTAGRCVRMGSPGTEWARGGHRRTEAEDDEVSPAATDLVKHKLFNSRCGQILT